MGAKTRGIVFEADVSRDVMPSTVTLIDRSRWKNNGTWTNGAYTRLPSGSWGMEGATGKRANMGSPDSIYCYNFSVSIWAYLTTSPSNRYVFSHGLLAGARGWHITWNSGVGKFAFFVADGANVNQSSYGNYSFNAWYHLAGVHVYNSSLTLYINGVAQTPAAIVGYSVPLNTTPLVLGGYSSLSSEWLGYYGLPKMYNYALTPTAIYKIFNAERSLFGV